MKATINGQSLAYTDEGRGLPVTFLHAFPLNRAMWLPQLSQLSSHCRIITLDLRGHGESEPASEIHSMDDLAGDVCGLLDHLSIKQTALVGLSMGGYVLFAFYRLFADRVKALIFADSRAQADTPEGRAGRFTMIETVKSQGPEAIADVMLPKLLTPASLHGNPRLVETIRGMILKTSAKTIAGDLRAMADRRDSTPDLSRIACPTLVLVGSLDHATPPADGRLLAGAIQRAELSIIEDAAHLANMEQPEKFNEALVSFLTRIG